MREINSFRELLEELNRRFPDRLPEIDPQAGVETAALQLARLNGQRDVLRAVANLIDPKRARTAPPSEE